MAAETGNIYISGTMTDMIEIPTANLRFSTTASSKKVFPGDRDNDRRPKWQNGRFGRQSCHFGLARSSLSQSAADTFATVINLRFAVGISVPSLTVSMI